MRRRAAPQLISISPDAGGAARVVADVLSGGAAAGLIDAAGPCFPLGFHMSADLGFRLGVHALGLRVVLKLFLRALEVLAAFLADLIERFQGVIALVGWSAALQSHIAEIRNGLAVWPWRRFARVTVENSIAAGDVVIDLIVGVDLALELGDVENVFAGLLDALPSLFQTLRHQAAELLGLGVDALIVVRRAGIRGD